MKSKRIYKSRKSRKSRSRKLGRTMRKQYRKQLKKQSGGYSMTHIESGIEGLTIEYFDGAVDDTVISGYKGANDLAEYLVGGTVTPKYDYVYVSIGSKTPPPSSSASSGKMVAGVYEPADTTNSDYQKIPGLFEAPSDTVKNILIIMLDMFQDSSHYAMEVSQIKERYMDVIHNNPGATIHMIMCNLQFVHNGTDPSVRENFVNTMLAYSNLLNAITQFTFEIQQLEPKRFLICNYIRFKHGNPIDEMLFNISNNMINWVLGGDPVMDIHVSKPNRDIEKQSIKFTDYVGVDTIGITRIDRGKLTDCHYIWAGYEFVNLIYKYTEHLRIKALINMFLAYPVPQIPGHVARTSQDILREYCNIHFNDDMCSTIPSVYRQNQKALKKTETPHHLHKLFRPHTFKMLGEEVEQNFRMVDFTMNYDYFLSGSGVDLYNINELPNIAELVYPDY